MRYFFLFILIAASLATFVMVINPRYKNIQALRLEVASFETKLSTAKDLKESREELINKYNTIPKADLDNLKTLLPDSVDNIRLIIQLDSLATKNNLSSLRDVQYDTVSDTPVKNDPVASQRAYSDFTMSFETTGPYKNFLAFASDLEQNLRLVDISEVQFSQVSQKGATDTMKYTVTIKTYWLKK